jgi:hypothetical protein
VASNDPHNPTPSSTSILVLDQVNAEMSSSPAPETLPSASTRSLSSVLPSESEPVGQDAHHQLSMFEKIRNFTQRKHLNQNR